MRAAPVVLALLLVCSAVAGAGGNLAVGTDASPPSASSADIASATAANATNATGGDRVLAIPQERVSNGRIDDARIDIGVAVGFEANASAERMETIALRQRVSNASTNDERQRRILDGMNELEKRTVTLRTAQQTAITEFAAGNIDARTLIVQLARIQAEADALELRLTVLSRMADRTDGNTLDSARIQGLVYQLRSFDGPVRERATDSIGGDAPPTRIYAAASDQSVVLTTVVDGEYVREVYRGDLRSLEGSSISEGVPENATAESYPEIWAASDGPTGSGSGGTFIVNVPYPGGRLTTFIDGGSERVFKEYQRISLANVSTGEARERTIDLTLRVNRTYAGGPLRIEVVDPETGEPIDAAVRIAANGEGSVDIGSTGEDGVLWTVAPRGTFVVTAIDEESDNLSTLELSSADPLTVREAYGRNESTDS